LTLRLKLKGWNCVGFIRGYARTWVPSVVAKRNETGAMRAKNWWWGETGGEEEHKEPKREHSVLGSLKTTRRVVARWGGILGATSAGMRSKLENGRAQSKKSRSDPHSLTGSVDEIQRAARERFPVVRDVVVV